MKELYLQLCDMRLLNVRQAKISDGLAFVSDVTSSWRGLWSTREVQSRSKAQCISVA